MDLMIGGLNRAFRLITDFRQGIKKDTFHISVVQLHIRKLSSTLDSKVYFQYLTQ